ncbi:hypothetical protein Desor_3173 [Desulfosporosinus orientis DSM 765]|uniref:Uncharacterized protein n=1 Tax=Desulfosporosinus orientis (strain ATCC 19365 / DSM 765 / NCIMB 8382 / VKM B-1628 / Singapore I) TaxID=768706 RepID=G7W937_DESOD|nr:hypothetical protein Desor_3173 [Desulfosporosinus orientis DSM 765]
MRAYGTLTFRDNSVTLVEGCSGIITNIIGL